MRNHKNIFIPVHMVYFIAFIVIPCVYITCLLIYNFLRVLFIFTFPLSFVTWHISVLWDY